MVNLKNGGDDIQGGTVESAAGTLQRQPKLADGCYHVFLDVGSNIGMHVRFLFEPFLYNKAHLARR